MDNGLENEFGIDGLGVQLVNFFQLEASITDSKTNLGKFTLTRNNVVIDTQKTNSGSYSYNLESYGNYVLKYEYIADNTNTILKSKAIKFNGFGADPNEIQVRRVAVLGISRLALVVGDLLRLSERVEVTFVSSNPTHIGSKFASEIVMDLSEVSADAFDEWILMNGVTRDVRSMLDSSGAEYDFLSANVIGPLEPYLNVMPIGKIHALAHAYYLNKLQVGADFLVRYIRKRYGSVLPASVDLSGARFAYGCISTVINKNAIVGKNVTIGQNVTIGGRNGVDPKLGDGVWIGAGAVVLGATIGTDSIIGANAVVTKDLAPGSTVVAAKYRELHK